MTQTIESDALLLHYYYEAANALETINMKRGQRLALQARQGACPSTSACLVVVYVAWLQRSCRAGHQTVCFADGSEREPGLVSLFVHWQEMAHSLLAALLVAAPNIRRCLQCGCAAGGGGSRSP